MVFLIQNYTVLYISAIIFYIRKIFIFLISCDHQFESDSSLLWWTDFAKTLSEVAKEKVTESLKVTYFGNHSLMGILVATDNLLLLAKL